LLPTSDPCISSTAYRHGYRRIVDENLYVRVRDRTTDRCAAFLRVYTARITNNTFHEYADDRVYVRDTTTDVSSKLFDPNEHEWCRLHRWRQLITIHCNSNDSLVQIDCHTVRLFRTPLRHKWQKYCFSEYIVHVRFGFERVD